MFDKNNGKCLKGVNCTVSNCVHHCGMNDCKASSISVGGGSANAKSETLCSTFESK